MWRGTSGTNYRANKQTKDAKMQSGEVKLTKLTDQRVKKSVGICGLFATRERSQLEYIKIAENTYFPFLIEILRCYVIAIERSILKIKGKKNVSIKISLGTVNKLGVIPSTAKKTRSTLHTPSCRSCSIVLRIRFFYDITGIYISACAYGLLV